MKVNPSVTSLIIGLVLGVVLGVAIEHRDVSEQRRYEMRMIGGTVPVRIDKARGTAEILPITRMDNPIAFQPDEVITPPPKR